MVVQPILLYEAECLPVKNSYVQKMHVVEMRMLRWMCDHTRSDKILRLTEAELHGGKRIEMILTCEEEMHRHTSEDVRKVGYRGYEKRQR
ncbi:hypothetical protein H5410_044145 [Solanum commersonii]|uniref:Uncharacterized protein n=1 Tax=Solanum commersonii TaxID=4109 RepID=A0A9J5X7L2_SOLCO|nr:hypothetical protein H5410_044145 [Solanum commersonii]